MNIKGEVPVAPRLVYSFAFTGNLHTFTGFAKNSNDEYLVLMKTVKMWDEVSHLAFTLIQPARILFHILIFSPKCFPVPSKR